MIAAAAAVAVGLTLSTAVPAQAWNYTYRFGGNSCGANHPTLRSVNVGNLVHQIGDGDAGGGYQFWNYSNGSAQLARVSKASVTTSPWATIGYDTSMYDMSWYCLS